jgi:hypothetical protein
MFIVFLRVLVLATSTDMMSKAWANVAVFLRGSQKRRAVVEPAGKTCVAAQGLPDCSPAGFCHRFVT